jgi:hypothetical protein
MKNAYSAVYVVLCLWCPTCTGTGTEFYPHLFDSPTQWSLFQSFFFVSDQIFIYSFLNMFCIRISMDQSIDSSLRNRNIPHTGNFEYHISPALLAFYYRWQHCKFRNQQEILPAVFCVPVIVSVPVLYF